MTLKSFVFNFYGAFQKNYFSASLFYYSSERLLSGYFILISVITET